MFKSRVVAAVVAVCVLALAGCGEDNPKADPKPSPTPTESVSSVSPAAPTEPVLPEAATKATEDGARAFLKYYWDLVNYAQNTGDVNPLKRVSGSSCTGCSAGIEGVEDLYEAGGRVVGGQNALTISEVEEAVAAQSDLYGIRVTYVVRNEPQTIIRADGSREDADSGQKEFLSYLLWVDEAWRTDVLKPQ